jgi:ribosome-associated heat shock protein Hsp15
MRGSSRLGRLPRIVSGGGVRVNGTRASKPAASVGPGDVLTFAQARAIRVIRIVGVGVRRGPATEAQALYDDLDPPGDGPAPGARPARRPASHEEGASRPDDLRDPEA